MVASDLTVDRVASRKESAHTKQKTCYHLVAQADICTASGVFHLLGRGLYKLSLVHFYHYVSDN